MHPESAAGLHFALHHPDKFLAFFGSDGDTLHWRPSLWWLDGCGVFTMPQGTVACSIILCTYLAPPPPRRLSPSPGARFLAHSIRLTSPGRARYHCVPSAPLVLEPSRYLRSLKRHQGSCRLPAPGHPRRSDSVGHMRLAFCHLMSLGHTCRSTHRNEPFVNYS